MPFRGSVALVHDYLNQRGGAEKVVLELASMWPRTSIYTSIYRPSSTHPTLAQYEIRTSVLNRLPVDAGFRTLAPLYPMAFRSLGTLTEDLIITSTSGWAHGVRASPSSVHIVYCHTPARWLYSPQTYFRSARWERPLRPVIGALKSWDQAAARRADAYLVNAYNVRDRVRRIYGIDAEVVPPPVDVERFTPRARGERLLVVARLLAYKRVDLVVEAATRLGIGLDVVGTGPELSRLRSLAGPNVTFHGVLDDAAVTALMESCRTVCMPGQEDFGIVAVEANAAGKPVVAFAGGGALEALDDGFSAAFFQEPTVDAVIAAVHRADAIQTAPEILAQVARRFAPAVFRRRVREAVAAVLERRQLGRNEHEEAWLEHYRSARS